MIDCKPVAKVGENHVFNFKILGVFWKVLTKVNSKRSKAPAALVSADIS